MQTRTLPGLCLCISHSRDFTEVAFEFVHASLESSAIHFELRFATALPSTDTATLTP